MNILLVSDVYLPTVSGVASSTDSIARYMAHAGHIVFLVCPHPISPYDPKPPKNLTIRYTPSREDPLFVNKATTMFPLAWGPVRTILAKEHIDIVHIQEPGSIGIVALILSKLYRTPMVGADHFSLLQVKKVAPPYIRWASVPFMKLYIKCIYRLYDAIMVPTKTAKKELTELIGIPDRIQPVSNGVDTDLYIPHIGSKTSLYKRYGLDPGKTHFLYLGRLDPDKNIDTILHALHKTPEDIHFLLAGTGKETRRLRSVSKELGLQNRITWLQDLNTKAIIDLYHIADVFVIMSPVETQSIVALQALACGLPVIAADAGALPELVVHGENGFALPTYDADALSEKMIFLAAHPKLREQMGKKGRTLSLAHHKPVALAQLEKLFRSVLSGKTKS